MTNKNKYQTCKTYKSKSFTDGAVIYLADNADTIQLDNISFCLLERIDQQRSTLVELVEYLSNISNLTKVLSVKELMPYIDALFSQNLIMVCKH